MDGKLPPWNIHGSHSNRVPYTSGECQEEHDVMGESMPSLSSCMSGAFKALLPDYHETSSAMTSNAVKYPYSPDPHCPIKRGPGMSYMENTVVRRMPLDEASVTQMLPPKCAQYVPQEKELDHGNSSNWTSVIKHALEMSNGMEMEQTLSVDVCSPLVELNPVYKQPQTEISSSKPNEKQDGREVKGEQDSFVAMLSDGICRQQNVQDTGINQKLNIFAGGSSLSREELGMTVIRRPEPVSLQGFYSSHTPHLLDDFMKCDEFPLVKTPVEHTLLKTTQRPELCKVGSPRKTLESCTNISKVNNETLSDNSTVCGLYNLDLQKGGLQAEVMDGKTLLNSQNYPSNYNDQEEMGNQNNLHVSDTTLKKHFESKVENQVSTPVTGGAHSAVAESENSKLWMPREGFKNNLCFSEHIKSERLNIKNTESKIKLETKVNTEVVTLSNENLSSDTEVTEQTVVSTKMFSDMCKDSQGESNKLNKLCSKENKLKNGTVTLTTSPLSVHDSTDVYDIQVQEKQSPNESSVLIPSGIKAQNSKKTEQTFLNNATHHSNGPGTENVLTFPPHPISGSNCSTQHNLQNVLQRHKKPRKRKKSELEELNGQILKSTKMGDCSLYGPDISEKPVKPEAVMSEGEGFVTQSSSQLQGSHNEQHEVVTDAIKTSQQPGHICSEASEKDTSDAGNVIQVGYYEDKPSHTIRKTVYRRKRKRISRLCLKAKISATLSSPKEDYTSHSQVTLLETKAVSNEEQSSSVSQETICNSHISIAECKPEKHTQKSRKKKTLQTINEGESKGDSTQASKVCHNASQQEDVLSSVEASQVGISVKRVQKARSPAIKTFGDKNDKPLDKEFFLDSVSQTDSVSASVTDPSNVLSPQNNPRNPRQKRRADVSEADETLKGCQAEFPPEEIPSPISKFKENMETSKTARPVKTKRPGKRATRKNVSEDHASVLLHTSTDTLKQDSVSTAGTEPKIRTRKTPVKKVSPNTVCKNYETAYLNDLVSSASGESVEPISATENTTSTSSKKKKTAIKSTTEQKSTIGETCSKQEVITAVPSTSVVSPEKTVKARRCSSSTSRRKTNDTNLNGNLDGETSLLSIMTQENSASPSKMDSSSRPKKSRKKTVPPFKDKETLEIKHTESLDEDLAAVPDGIIEAPSKQMSLKGKRVKKEASRHEVENRPLLDMQTSTSLLKQADGVPTSFVLTTPKKSKRKKISDIKFEAEDISAVDQTIAQQEISTVLAESDTSNVRRIRTPQTSATNISSNIPSENFEPAQNELISPATGHSFDSVLATETDYSDVFSQQNTVKTKRPTKKATTRKKQVNQAINNFNEQISPATVQENSVLTKGVLSNALIKNDVVNKTAKDYEESQIFVPTEDVTCPPSSQKKTKKNCLKQKEMDEQKLHNSTSQEIDKMSETPSMLKESVSENLGTSGANICDQKWKAAKRKSKKFRHIAEAHDLAGVSASSGELGNILKTNEIKTEPNETDVMVTNADMQKFFTCSDGQVVKGLQCSGKDGSEVDVTVKQETTIIGLKITKPRTTKKKKRKTAKKKRKVACLLAQKVKEEEQGDISSETTSDIQSNLQAQILAVIPKEPVKSNICISRKSSRIQKINSGPVVETLSTQVSSTLDITESSTRPEETLSSSMHTVDCKDLNTVHAISMSTKKNTSRRGRQKKKKLLVAHLEECDTAAVQISGLSPCQESPENTADRVKQNVGQPIKMRGRKDNVTVYKKLHTDPSDLSVADQNDGTLSPSISEPGCKEKNFKRPVRNLKLSSLRVSSRTSELTHSNTDTSSLPQEFTKVLKKVELKTWTGKKRKLHDETIQDEVVKIKEINHGKHGQKRQAIKEPCFDLETQHDELYEGLKTEATNNEISPNKSSTTMISLTDECSNSIEDQNNIFTFSSGKSDNEKMKSTDVEIMPKTEIICSSPTLSSRTQFNLIKDVKKKVKEKKNTSEVSLHSCVDSTGVYSEISGLLPSSEISKVERKTVLLDTKSKTQTELRCALEANKELSVETTENKCLDNSSETEMAYKINAFQLSAVQKVDGFTQYDKDHVVIPNKLTSIKRSSKSREMAKKPLTCKFCGVSFRHITAYVSHQRIHTGKKPYKCRSCGQTFAQLSKLKAHQNVHKQQDAFPCPCCSQKFLQREDLLCHFKVHLQESEVNTKPQKNKREVSADVSSKNPNNYRGHICKFCKKYFINHVKLRIHMHAHEAEKPLQCKDCGKTFWKSSALAFHERKHWPVKPYACSICGKGFHQLKALKKHSEDHTGETPFSCSHCGHAFSALSALRVHQASKTCIAKRNDGESCDIEGFIVSQGVDGQVNTPVFFRCQICKQLFKKWCQYTLHLQTHTSSSTYLCFSCGQCYEKDSEVHVHCKVCCQSSGEEEICGASVSEIMQSFNQTRPDSCRISKNTSDLPQSLPSKKYQLNTQTRTTLEVKSTETRVTGLSELPNNDSDPSLIKLPVAHSPAHSEISCGSSNDSLECIEISPSLWKFQCLRCGQRFERYRMLQTHMQTHAPGFRYTCTHCGQFFERWSKLWLHQRRHRLKGRCYSCTQCSLQFRYFGSYKEHMLEHAMQRPYACPLCPQTFIQEESLHAHQSESHQRCQSLKCDVCSKTFSSLRNLIRHSYLHNGSTSHVCLLCSVSFTNTRALQQHLKTHGSYHGPPLPDIPVKPLDFPHKCKRCKACFSTGDLLYAHQICHSKNAKAKIRPAVQPTSESPGSRTDKRPVTPLARTNHISNLKLDGIPNDKSLYQYSHPDSLYVPPSLSRARRQFVDLDSNEPEVISDSQDTSPEVPDSNPSDNNEGSTQVPPVASQSDRTHLPQTTSGQENNPLISNGNIKDMTNDNVQSKCNYSYKHQRRSAFVETSFNMGVAHEESKESFECADCTEKLTSVLGLYEHYILHAMGDAYVQVH